MIRRSATPWAGAEDEIVSQAIRFLEALDGLLGSGADVTSPGELETARAPAESLRIADPGARFDLGRESISWRGRPVASIADFPRLAALRESGVESLSPPDSPDAFACWVRSLAGVDPDRPAPAQPGPDTSGPPEDVSRRILSLHEEAAVNRHVARGGPEDVILRLLEATAVGAATPLPLGGADEAYTSVHCLNTARLSMGLARHLAFADDEVVEVGIAALLHDLGMALVQAPPGLSPEGPAYRELVLTHPSVGARLLMDSGTGLHLAAVVAYEHHMSWDGKRGHPARKFPVSPHRFSRIVSLSDTYDVLRTERKFRPALTEEAARTYLRVLGGGSLDPELVTGFQGWLDAEASRFETPATRPAAALGELGWLPESGFDPDLEPRPVRL